MTHYSTILMVKLIQVAHLLIMLFIIAGWAFPHPLIWHLYFITIPATILQWRLNKNKCLLTNLELFLREKLPKEESQAEERSFVKRVFGVFCKEIPSDQFMKRLVYSWMWTGWAISALRIGLAMQ